MLLLMILSGRTSWWSRSWN